MNIAFRINLNSSCIGLKTQNMVIFSGEEHAIPLYFYFVD